MAKNKGQRKGLKLNDLPRENEELSPQQRKTVRGGEGGGGSNSGPGGGGVGTTSPGGQSGGGGGNIFTQPGGPYGPSREALAAVDAAVKATTKSK
jgi:hypothetical protein